MLFPDCFLKLIIGKSTILKREIFPGLGCGLTSANCLRISALVGI